MTELPSIPEIKSSVPLHVHRINFTRDIADLIWWADTNLNASVAVNEVYRPPEMAQIYAQKGLGINNSLHCLGLAVDLLVYVGNIYQTDIEQYRRLGQRWKELSPLNRWGGDFHRLDLDHFERHPE
jgi:hypothetical protein